MKATSLVKEVAFVADDTASARPSRASKRTYAMTCQECGGAFTATRSDARFCSKSCVSRSWRREHPDEARAQNRERNRRFREAHPERIREKKRETGRRYRQAHPERVREINRRYVQANPEKVAEWTATQRQKEAAVRQPRPAFTGPYRVKNDRKHGRDWREVRAAFWEAQEGCCYLCGDPLRTDKPQSVVFDHNHECCPQDKSCSTCRRGLACSRCNLAIGYALDDPARLRRIADSLEAANTLFSARLTAKSLQEARF
jgi:hypothetical protein